MTSVTKTIERTGRRVKSLSREKDSRGLAPIPTYKEVLSTKVESGSLSRILFSDVRRTGGTNWAKTRTLTDRLISL